MAQHIPEGQVGVFLAALYQLMCTQQQGITSMVVAQARVPVHLGVHSWAMQASMTRLFAQVIPGLGSFSGSAPASIAGSTWMDVTARGSDGRNSVHTYTLGREYDGPGRVVSRKADQE